jgi:hypothetical protein
MAISPRCELGFGGSASSASPTLINWTNAGVTGFAGTAPAVGDMVFVIGAIIAATQTITQTGGTGTWTIKSSDDNANGVEPLTTFVAYKKWAGTETAPTFAWQATASYACVAQAIGADANSTLDIEVWATLKVDTTAGTTHTPNSLSAANIDESLILIAGVASGNGTTAISTSAPSNWTKPTSAVRSTAGTSTTPGCGAGTFYRSSQTGTITPGACTIKGGTGTNGTTYANVYHVALWEGQSAAVDMGASAGLTAGALVTEAGVSSMGITADLVSAGTVTAGAKQGASTLDISASLVAGASAMTKAGASDMGVSAGLTAAASAMVKAGASDMGVSASLAAGASAMVKAGASSVGVLAELTAAAKQGWFAASDMGTVAELASAALNTILQHVGPTIDFRLALPVALTKVYEYPFADLAVSTGLDAGGIVTPASQHADMGVTTGLTAAAIDKELAAADMGIMASFTAVATRFAGANLTGVSVSLVAAASQSQFAASAIGLVTGLDSAAFTAMTALADMGLVTSISVAFEHLEGYPEQYPRRYQDEAPWEPYPIPYPDVYEFQFTTLAGAAIMGASAGLDVGASVLRVGVASAGISVAMTALAPSVAILPGTTTWTMEAGIVGWSGTGGPRSLSTDYAHSGSYSILGSASAATVEMVTPKVPISGNSGAEAIGWVLIPVGGKTTAIHIGCYDTNGTYITEIKGTSTVIAAGVWTQYRARAEPSSIPPGTVTVAVHINAQNMVAGQTVYADDIQITVSYAGMALVASLVAGASAITRVAAADVSIIADLASGAVAETSVASEFGVTSALTAASAVVVLPGLSMGVVSGLDTAAVRGVPAASDMGILAEVTAGSVITRLGALEMDVYCEFSAFVPVTVEAEAGMDVYAGLLAGAYAISEGVVSAGITVRIVAAGTIYLPGYVYANVAVTTGLIAGARVQYFVAVSAGVIAGLVSGAIASTLLRADIGVTSRLVAGVSVTELGTTNVGVRVSMLSGATRIQLAMSDIGIVAELAAEGKIPIQAAAGLDVMGELTAGSIVTALPSVIMGVAVSLAAAAEYTRGSTADMGVITELDVFGAIVRVGAVGFRIRFALGISVAGLMPIPTDIAAIVFVNAFRAELVLSAIEAAVFRDPGISARISPDGIGAAVSYDGIHVEVTS